jgi:triacylglycerol lipase
MATQFDPAATDFRPANALRLGEAAELAYEDEPTVQAKFAAWGMTGVFLEAVVPPSGDTQVAVAADAKKVIVAFRGTKDVLDFLTDARFAFSEYAPAGTVRGRVHTGFLLALDVVWARLDAAIRAARDRNQSIWVTGHSLGAALATLAVARLRNAGVDVHGLYTFGSPAVGDAEFARTFDTATRGRVFRYVNDLDIVTHCPPEGVPRLPPYQHVGADKYFDACGKLSDAPDRLRLLSVAAAMVSIAIKGRTLSREQLKRDLAQHLKEPLADHAMAGYVTHLGAADAAPPPAAGPRDAAAGLLGELSSLRRLWGK